MKKYSILLMASLLLLAGCQKTSTKDYSPNVQTGNVQVNNAKAVLIEFINTQHLADRFAIAVNPVAKNSKESRIGAQYKLTKNADFNGNLFRIKKAINPDDYECGPTIIDEYINNSVATWTDQDFTIYFTFSFLIWDYAYLYQNSDASGVPYFGDHGEYTNVNKRTFRDLQNFWDIPDDIYLTASHGDFFNDINKVTLILKTERDLGWINPAITDAQIAQIAQLLQTVFGSSNFQEFKHPLLTFNAFAAPPDPEFNTPSKVVMGDGIQKAYFDLGLGDVATQAILSHEYAHQVQFANMVPFDYTPEGTRTTELMADALSAYYLTHKRGAAMNWHRVQDFLAVFYGIGDCAFDDPGHHGTPNQRMKAAEFGYTIASSAQKQGKIMSSSEFIKLFYEALPGIVAPDANN